MHGNLKPTNILLDKDNCPFYSDIHLARQVLDFGEADVNDDEQPLVLKGVAAPELINE